ncbi:hypothetical protein V2J09_007978 [Rumex salicifolius]
MTNDHKINYICKRTAIGTKAVKPGQTHPLSALDRIMEAHHIRAVYYYRTPVVRPIGATAKRLKESLAETLNHFPAMCGRLVRNDAGDWSVKCNDAGVRMVEARAKGSVETWLESVSHEDELLLVLWEDMFHISYCWSTFYVQLTEFEEGGLALGLSCTHLLADPITLSSFMKAWADTTFHKKILDPAFFHPLPPRRLIEMGPKARPKPDLISHYNSVLQNQASLTPKTTKTVTLLFSEEMVQACIDMARFDPAQPDPSPFQSLVGLFWAVINRVKKERAEYGLIGMSICTDVRKALRLDKGFFGNCMVYTKVDGEGLDSGNVGQAARAVGQAIDRVDSEGVKDLIEWLETHEIRDNLHRNPNLPRIDGGDHIICMDLEKTNLYSFQFDSDFETLKASYYVEPLFGPGRVLVLPSPPSKGQLSRMVNVTLPGDEIQKLCNDDVILSLFPSILTNMRTYST